MSSELLSSCCGVHVPDLAGDGVGGLDICPKCGEWCGIVGEDEDMTEEDTKPRKLECSCPKNKWDYHYLCTQHMGPNAMYEAGIKAACRALKEQPGLTAEEIIKRYNNDEPQPARRII